MRRFRSETMAKCDEAHVNGLERAEISIRRGEIRDCGRIAGIFNQGVEDRVATFETRHAELDDATSWVTGDLVIVAERDGTVVAWAKASPYADRHAYYDGVREATMYVERDARGSGIGRALLGALPDFAAEAGAHKLVGKIFTTNEPSIALVRGLGWTEVGVHRRHGALDGDWKDVLVVEKLIAPE